MISQVPPASKYPLADGHGEWVMSLQIIIYPHFLALMEYRRDSQGLSVHLLVSALY